MSKKYDVCARIEIDGREKPVWPKIGMTITVKDDGKIGLYDARTGQNYFAFERQPRPEAAQAAPQQAPAQSQNSGMDGFEDKDIPF